MLKKVFTIALLLAANPVFAQTAKSKLTGIFCDVFDLIYTIALVVGIIFTLIAAFKYMSAGGESSKISDAHKSLLWGAIGIAVALIAPGVPQIITSFLGGSATAACP